MKQPPEFIDPKRLKKLLREIRSPQRYDAATLLRRTVTDPRYGVGCSVAMDRINSYLVGARNQLQRIKRSITRLNRSNSEVETFGASQASRRALRQVFLDVHYYFVCWNTIYKMILFLKDRSSYKAVNDVYKCHKSILTHYGEARDHLEHYSDRIEGRKKNKNLVAPWDMGNLHGYVYTLGGERYDTGPDSLKKLEKIVSDLSRKICEEGTVRFQKIREGRI